MKVGDPKHITKNKQWDSDWLAKLFPHRFEGNWIPDDAELYDIQISREGLKVSDRGDYRHDYTPRPSSTKKKKNEQLQFKI